MAERPFTPAPGKTLRGIDPHHLSNARQTLLAQGIIETITDPTRGGSTPVVLVLKDRYKRKTITNKAIQRKRLLQARYTSWTQESKAHNIPNLIGAGGELRVAASLEAAAARGVGYRLEPRPRGGIASLFGQQVPGGSLDHAANLILPSTAGHLPIVATVLVEVKNVRHWIYRGSWEIYQLLDKAAQLQLQYPNHLFIPVLVCRRSQYLAFMLSQSIGFFILYTVSQALLPHSSVDPQAVEEVNRELGYNLVLSIDPHPELTDAFCGHLPTNGHRAALRFAKTAPICAKYAPILRDSGLLARDQAMHEQTLTTFLTEIAKIPMQDTSGMP